MKPEYFGSLALGLQLGSTYLLGHLSSKKSSGYPPGPTLMATMGHEQRAAPWGGGDPKHKDEDGEPKIWTRTIIWRF